MQIVVWPVGLGTGVSRERKRGKGIRQVRLLRERVTNVLTNMTCSCTAIKQRALLAIISCISVIVGYFIWFKAVSEQPKPQLNEFGRLNLAQARKAFGFPDRSLLMCQGPKCLRFERFLMTLIFVFKDMVDGDAGRGGFMLVLSMLLPIVLFMCVQAVKPETHFLQRGFIVTLVMMLGQGICIGASVPLVYVPLFALVRGLTLHKTYPERPFGRYAPSVITPLVSSITILSLITVFFPRDHWMWPHVNVVFQFSPMLLLGLSLYLVVIGRQKSVTTTKISEMYENNLIFSMLMYWVGLYLLKPTIGRVFRGEDTGLTDGQKLILWDSIGLLLTMILLVALDAVADYQLKFEQTRALHNGSLKKWIVGTIRSIFMGLLFGPGAVLDLYYAGREDVVTPVHSFIPQDIDKKKKKRT